MEYVTKKLSHDLAIKMNPRYFFDKPVWSQKLYIIIGSLFCFNLDQKVDLN